MRAVATKTVAIRAGAICGAAAILTMLAYEVAHGTRSAFALGLAVSLFIPLCYVAIERPLVFPFGLYALLIPLDDILSLGKIGTINKLIGILAFAAVLFGLLRRGQFVKPSSGVIAWMAVAVWIGLSGFWAIDQHAWIPAYLTFIQNFLLYALVAMTISTIADLEAISSCVVIGGFLACAVGLWPYLHGQRLDGRLVLPGPNPYDPPDPNHFAAALLLPFAVLLAASLGTRKIVPLLANLGGLALLVITIVLTGSRAAMVSVLVLSLYTLVRGRRSLFTGAAMVVAAAAILPFAGWIQQRWSTALSMGGAGRTDIWHVAMLAFGNYWLIGAGFASFPAVFNQEVLHVNLFRYAGWSKGPHDMIISNAVELGVIGLLLVVAEFVMVFRDLSVPRIGGFPDDLRVALQGAVLAIFLDGLFLDITNRKYLWLLFIMVALLRSTILNAAVTEQRRRTACAAPSFPTPAPTSEPRRSLV